MDAKTFTDRSYECDQSIASVLSAVQRFRLEWGTLAGRLAFENLDVQAATESLNGSIASLAAVSDAMKEVLEKFIADIAKERAEAAGLGDGEPGNETLPGNGGDTQPAAA